MNESITTIVSVECVLSTAMGGCLFSAITEDERFIQVSVPFTKLHYVVNRGEVYKVKGVEIWHDTYGPQIIADEFSAVIPTRNVLTSFLTKSPVMRGFGFGKKKALKVCEYFGDELVDVLDSGEWIKLVSENPSLLTEPIAKELVTRWKEYSEYTEIITFVINHGLDNRAAVHIQRRYKSSAIDMLKEDPYRLVAFVSPSKKNWDVVDAAAIKLGVTLKCDPRRLIGAAEMAIYSVHDTGNTAVTTQRLRKKIRNYVNDPVEAINAAMSSGLLVVNHNGDVQHSGVASIEEWVGSRLRVIGGLPDQSVPSSLFNAPFLDEAVASSIKSHQDSEGWLLNEEQKQAVKSALQKSLTVITGGAGVGKTSVLKVIGDTALRHGRQLYQLALAGRAAKRIQEATSNKAYTIAGFVNAVKNGKIELDEGAFIVVDESSMVSLADIAKLLRLLPTNIHLILVGDDFQLPPVSFGEVFTVAASDSSIQRTHLSKVYRQDEKTGIPVIANSVRDQVLPTIPTYTGLGEGVFFHECGREAIDETIFNVYKDLSSGGETQVLSLTNTGIGGVQSINSIMREKLRDGKRRTCDGELFVGDPLLYLTNDYEQELFNGSLGLITGITDTEGGEILSVLWDDGASRDILAQSYKTDFNLAYSITVHKAQGSQFERVIIPIRKGRMLNSRMVYTALTRAVKQVVFVGLKEALSEAVLADPKMHERNVGLRISVPQELSEDDIELKASLPC